MELCLCLPNELEEQHDAVNFVYKRPVSSVLPTSLLSRQLGSMQMFLEVEVSEISLMHQAMTVFSPLPSCQTSHYHNRYAEITALLSLYEPTHDVDQ